MAPYVGVMRMGVFNFFKALAEAKANDFGVLAATLTPHNIPKEYIMNPMLAQRFENAYSDLVLTGTQWNSEMILISNLDIDCDSEIEHVRKHSEQALKEDIAMAEYLLSGGYMMVKLKSKNITNTARIFADKAKGNVLVWVPAYSTDTYHAMMRKDQDESLADYDGWEWWNRFRWINDFNPKMRLSLELDPAHEPSDEVIRRWLGEPLDSIIIPTAMFKRNKSNSPVLLDRWYPIVTKFIAAKANVIIAPQPSDNNLIQYANYIKDMQKSSNGSAMPSYDDVLEIPLQPLHDDLNCFTYEVFEKDPVKYILYQKAIVAALEDRVPENEISTKVTIIMILGAGRGPLIRCALNASNLTNRKIRIYVIEKNPNAIRTLLNIASKLWTGKDVHIFSQDMREFSPPEKADILVSELLGSFGDNELSPECLDCAARLLKSDGISIPCKSTSYINPVMSSRIYCAVRNISRAGALGSDKYSINHISKESGFVVLLRNVFNISKAKRLFEFVHPNRTQPPIDNSRYRIIKFEAKVDAVLNGVGGYFEAILYKDIMLSINPDSHTENMTSWFPIFFPFTDPINLKGGDVIEIHFWRCIDSYKVWYEWCLVSPIRTHVHNLNGRYFPIYLS